MADTEDKWLFEWVDRFDPEELHGLHSIEPFEIEAMDNEAFLRIKKRTFDRLDLPTETRRFIIRKWLIAACAAFVLCMAIISTSHQVRAELKKVLQFIPGFGYLEESDDTVQVAYVLLKPIEAIGKNGIIKIDGMLIQGNKAQIGLSGDQSSAIAIETLIFSTDQGKYVFKRSIASWGGDWQATYYYEGDIPSVGLDNAMIQFGKTNIGPFKLTKAQSADDLTGLGQSDSNNGIRITSIVTPLEGNQRKVNLLTQLPNKQIVDSFGKQPISEGLQLQLVDSKNQSMQILKDLTFTKPHEFIFEDSTKGMEHYQLTIPSIRIIDYGAAHQKVTIPIPAAGSMEVHQTITMGGLPLDFTKVERIDGRSIQLTVDTHFDAAQLKTLQSFRLFSKKSFYPSYSTQLNESTNATIMEYLSVEPEQKKLVFYVGEPQIVIKGPWVLSGLQ